MTLTEVFETGSSVNPMRPFHLLFCFVDPQGSWYEGRVRDRSGCESKKTQERVESRDSGEGNVKIGVEMIRDSLLSTTWGRPLFGLGSREGRPADVIFLSC